MTTAMVILCWLALSKQFCGCKNYLQFTNMLYKLHNHAGVLFYSSKCLTLAQIDLCCVDVPLNTKQTKQIPSTFAVCVLVVFRLFIQRQKNLHYNSANDLHGFRTMHSRWCYCHFNLKFYLRWTCCLNQSWMSWLIHVAFCLDVRKIEITCVL